MNIKRIKKLRDFIAGLPKKACDMHTWLDPATSKKTEEEVTPEEMQKRGFKCGTVGCLGGWTQVMIGLNKKYKNKDINSGQYLGLDIYEENSLFHTYPYPDDNFNWKQWMLARLDGIIKDRRIEDANAQMDGVPHNGYSED